MYSLKKFFVGLLVFVLYIICATPSFALYDSAPPEDLEEWKVQKTQASNAVTFEYPFTEGFKDYSVTVNPEVENKIEWSFLNDRTESLMDDSGLLSDGDLYVVIDLVEAVADNIGQESDVIDSYEVVYEEVVKVPYTETSAVWSGKYPLLSEDAAYRYKFRLVYESDTGNARDDLRYIDSVAGYFATISPAFKIVRSDTGKTESMIVTNEDDTQSGKNIDETGLSYFLSQIKKILTSLRNLLGT